MGELRSLHTIYKNIQQLLPGHLLLAADNGTINKSKYYDLTNITLEELKNKKNKLSLRIKPINTDSISFKDHHHFNEQSLFIRTNKFLEEKTRSYIVELQHNELVDDMDEIYSFFRQDHLLHDIQYDSIVNTEFDEEERQHLLKSLLSNLLSSLSDKKNKLHEMDVIQTIGYVP
ncbi:unnamed protein product [Rotaria sp. Silwood2]|nr:unnamed protein product [Rotaria sp. Silwood2]CAF4485486.1 unnamed protein product [Rotaria sp. Silwood2]